MKNDRYSCKDRVTGAVCDDERSDNTPLAFLYGSGSLSRLARRLARRPFLSKLIGWKYNRPAAPKHLRRFVEQWGIDMAEAELPIEGYATINDLFARRLKPGVRPIDCSPNALVSAADARALVFPSLEGIHLPVKNGNYSIATLIEDEHAAQRFADGAAAVLRLAPRDYHRFHFPADGVAGEPRRIPGLLDSVAPQALARDPQLFCRNQRDVVMLRSDQCGAIAIIAIGAVGVGSIVHTYIPGPVKRGEEQGYFKFGGSSIVMLFEKDRVRFDRDLIENTQANIETVVRMGMRMGTMGNPARTSG